MPKAYNPKDKYYQKAKDEGHRARSYFKLEEIQAEYPLIKKGDSVLDLGAAPGSFLELESTLVGKDGTVIGIDLKEIEKIPGATNVHTYVRDIFTEKTILWLHEKLKATKAKEPFFDVVISDMAPNTSGIKDVDHFRSIELCEQVNEVIYSLLKEGGNAMMKIFQGEEFDMFVKDLKKSFTKVVTVKPQATRDRSREVFLVCLGYKHVERYTVPIEE